MSAEIYKVSGRKFELSPSSEGKWSFQVRPGGWIVAERPLKDGSGTERRRFLVSERKGKLSASTGGKLFYGDVTAALRGSSAGGGSDADFIAQFPGKVRKILVQEGQEVQTGDKLLLVEAMKMEFAVLAHAASRVKKLLVKEGQQLSPGDRFLDLEPLTEKSKGGKNGKR